MGKCILSAIAMIVFFSSPVLADGGFYGEVTYRDCDVTLGDRVWITPLAGGDPSYYYIEHLHEPPTYTTGQDTFPPGTYKLTVGFGPGSECVLSEIEKVVHGSSTQRVDLNAFGDTGQPDGGGGGE